MKNAYQQLEAIFRKINHLNHASAICHWDEAVMMPPGGGASRAEALATLHSLSHELLIDPKVGYFINQAKSITLESPWQQANLYWMEEAYRKANCLPTELVQQSTLAFIRSEQAWRNLRQANNWQDFVPFLSENIKWTREIAAIKAEVFSKSAYDCLIDDYSPGLSQALIDPIFDQLKGFLPVFIHEVMAKQSEPLSPKGYFTIDAQRQLGLELMRTLGFDFQHGRLDVSHHPFCGGVPQDVRITTRYTEEEFISSAMAVCHETGHALYERHLPIQWLDQPVGVALGMALHESQSLLFEMQACRSHEFMQFFSNLIIKQFGENSAFSVSNLYACYTQVKPGLIRVDADEVCYPLHVILRYELEKQLIAGKINVNDLPELWDQSMRQFFNLSTKNDYRNGVMQDVHWPSGAFGYFPAYTIGAIIAAQLFQEIKRQQPDILSQLSTGNFSNLVKWLGEKVHGQGRLLGMNALLTQATGSPLKVEPFIKHLQDRYQS